MPKKVVKSDEEKLTKKLLKKNIIIVDNAVKEDTIGKETKSQVIKISAKKTGKSVEPHIVIEKIEPIVKKKSPEKKIPNKKVISIPQVIPLIPQIPVTKLTVLDLFAGCGGFSKGITDAGLNVLAGIDIWEPAVKTYSRNLNHLSLCKDLKDYPPENLSSEHAIKHIDVLIGGPPCQGFSMSGKRDKNDPRNTLFMEYIKYLNYFKPKAFLMENVVGILSMKTAQNVKVVDIIMDMLTKNYDCSYHKLLASDFEVPQNRRRVIFIGFRKDLKIVPTAPVRVLTEDQHIAVSTILEKREDIDQKYFLSTKALEGIRKKKERMKEKGNGFGAQYLSLDKPSYTIPARYWKDGYDALVKYSDTEIRKLTEKELAQIQTFPNDYVFEGTKKDIIMQIGNAVACRFGYWLGKYLIEKLVN